MMRIPSLVAVLALACLRLTAGDVPGVRLEKVARVEGFITSLAVSPGGALHASTRDGRLVLIDGDDVTEVTRIPTANVGNAALLGVAFAPDGSVIAHTVKDDLTADLILRIDPASAAAPAELRRYYCYPGGNMCSSEHHGGNLVTLDDGTIFVGIGDFGRNVPAQDPASPGGKVHRLTAGGSSTVFASGFRNPYDLAWDAQETRLIVSDNGPTGRDEINFVVNGDNCGWPWTMGRTPLLPGYREPAYVFPDTVAPTGLALISATRTLFDRSLLSTAFVTGALYYFPSVDSETLDAPVVLSAAGGRPLMDVVQDAEGNVFVASAYEIYRLEVPIPGDVDGNGELDRDDLDLLRREVAEGAGESRLDAPGGKVVATWGADVNLDGLVTSDDVQALVPLVQKRRRSIR